jgi:prepilin-type N-terminal cleavage/methylation domain-containing protein
MERRGFTLIELILIIAILGILAISALPRFLDLSESTEETHRDGVVGAVRAGMAIFHAHRLADEETTVWPRRLDDQGDGACTECFSAVLESGVNDERWMRSDDGLKYTFTTTGGKATNYAYDPSKGTFR